MGLLKAAIAEVFYDIWMYRNNKIFDNIGAYKNPQSVTRNIMDAIVYRGWMRPKYRNHIINILMYIGSIYVAISHCLYLFTLE